MFVVQSSRNDVFECRRHKMNITRILGLAVLKALVALAMINFWGPSKLYAGETKTETFRSPYCPSGQGRDFGSWCEYTTPEQLGWTISKVNYDLEVPENKQFRGCLSWAECVVSVRGEKSWTIRWRVQGDDSWTGVWKGNVVPARLRIVVTYVKP